MLLITTFVASPVAFSQIPGQTDASVDPKTTNETFLSNTVKGLKQAATVMQDMSTKMNSALQNVQNADDSAKDKINDINIAGSVQISATKKEKDQPTIPVGRKIEQCKIADITNEDSVFEAFKTLFLTYPLDIIEKYPEDRTAVRRAYLNKGLMFADDSMVEMYLTVRFLEERMDTLRAEFEELSQCFVAGQDGASSALCETAGATDQNLGIWNNYYRINLIYDSMLRITEELFAIRAQYEVAQAIRNGLEPLDKEMQQTEGDGNSSEGTNDKSANADGVFKYIRSIPIAHAQVVSVREQQNQPVSETLTQNVEETSTAATTKSNKSNKYEVVKAKPAVIRYTFKGAADQFKDLASSANVYEQLKLATNLHNLKQQMPTFRETFLENAKMRKLHEKSVEKLKESEDCAVNFLGKYYDNPQTVWLGAGCHYSGTKIICSSGRDVNSENLKNLQSGDILCPDNGTKICSNFGINGYSSRGGFSGWLVSAYKTAKAEKTVEINEEEISVSMLDDSNSADVADVENVSKQLLNESQLDVGDGMYINPSKELEVEDSTRESQLLGWRIGAEGAKALGQDMASSSPKWGQVKNTYPLWNDEKYFYDQYLHEKYRNMKLYVKNLDLRKAVVDAAQKISDSLTETELSGMSISDIKKFNNAVFSGVINVLQQSTEQPFETAIEVTKAENDKKLKQLSATFDRKLQSEESSQQAVYSRLDKYGVELNENKQAYNDAFMEEKNAAAQVEGEKTNLSLLEKRKAKAPNYVSGFDEKAESNISLYTETGTKAQANRETASDKVDVVREQIDTENIKLENIKQNISQIVSNYAKEASGLEAEGFLAVKEALSTMENGQSDLYALAGSDILNKAISSQKGKEIQKNILSMVVSLADSYAQQVKEKIISRIDEAYEEIQELKDDIYDVKNHDKLMAIHRSLIKDIAVVPNLEYISTTLPVGAITAAVGQIYANAISVAICSNDSCLQEDAAYFVGLPPKSQDFVAPKRIVESYTAPLREVVHFDTADYYNLHKSDDGKKTTRAEFMDYGQDIPQIWKLILSTGGFVERDVDIEQILHNNEGADDMLLRGGTYPCSIGKHDIEFKNGNLYAYPTTGKTSTCKGVKSVSLSSAGSVNVIFTSGDRVSGLYGNAPQEFAPSELSLLLKYDNTLALGDKITEIYEFFDNLKDDEIEENYGVKGEIYDNALLKRNQFGDFLKFVEIEMTYQKAMDKLNVKLDEIRGTITKELKKVGHELEEGFDLADEKTYNDLMQKLDEHKNKVLAHAISQLSQINPKNDSMQERADKLQNLLKALQMDSDEMVSISDNVSADSTLSEKIKRAVTDRAVKDKYKEEADDAFEKQLNNFDEPYCAVY